MRSPALEARRLPEWSTAHPRITVLIYLAVTIFFVAWLPRMRTDTDPKNMLPATSNVRVVNDEVEGWFALHKDVIVVGAVREPTIFEPAALAAIAHLTEGIAGLAGVVAAEVTSLTTADNVIAEEGLLRVEPLLPVVPSSAAEAQRYRESILSNVLATGRLASADGTATAIYVPLEPGANGKQVADEIRSLLAKEAAPGLRWLVAGDPVARDTFGAEMFRQMAVYAPLAGAIMLAALVFMFRSFPLALSLMAVAVMASAWSLGLLVAIRQPVHIMASMMPVFLMAIATDSIHIFNELYFRLREGHDRRAAILETLDVVGAPVRYTALATAAGFGILAIGHIIPVRVFGLFVAFGTMAIRIMSFSFIPAVLMLVPEDRLRAASRREEAGGRSSAMLERVGRFATRRAGVVLLAGLVILAAALSGIPKIRVNNNMVNWFKPSSDIRTADRIMNEKLGGTSLLYLVASGEGEDSLKDPERLRYVESLERELASVEGVGKITSVVDLLKRMNAVMVADGHGPEELPASRELAGQYLFLFSMSAKPSTLANLIDPAAQRANLWIQLKTWDAVAVERVLDRVAEFTRKTPPPGLTFQPAGIAYFNLVWNHEVLRDMVHTFVAALVVVLVILAASFRSLRWGLLSFVPLLFTIAVIYGAVGHAGKDFDMPISVLSTLSLGMAVDFAIHFLRRYRQRRSEGHEMIAALQWTVSRPGRGILRNAALFSLAFAVMMASTLTPYITVGVFIMSMMMLSATFTLLYLPALLVFFGGNKR